MCFVCGSLVELKQVAGGSLCLTASQNRAVTSAACFNKTTEDGDSDVLA